MVTTIGKTNVEKLMAGDTDGKPITHISVGTSNTLETPADTTITNAIDLPINNIEYLPGNKIRFSAELPSATPSFSIQEMGLKDSLGRLNYRKVKSPAFSHAVGLTQTLKYTIVIA